MIDEDVMRKAGHLLRGRIRLRKHPISSPQHWKEFWSLEIAGVNAVGWMMTLWCLLGERRRSQIVKVLKQWRQRPSAPKYGHKCPYGHELAQASIPHRRRHCLTCARERNARRRKTAYAQDKRQGNLA